MMNKNEICEKLVAVCNALDNVTVKGVQNAGNIAGCHSLVQEVVAFLMNCEIIPPDNVRESKVADGGDADG